MSGIPSISSMDSIECRGMCGLDKITAASVMRSTSCYSRYASRNTKTKIKVFFAESNESNVLSLHLFLYYHIGDFTNAKEEFSKSIYYSSRVHGAESIATSIGYFRLGDVFLALSFPENAMAFFDKVVDIWYKYLSSLLTKVESTARAVKEGPGGSLSLVSIQQQQQVQMNDLEVLNEENMSEGRGQLQAILEHRKNILGPEHIATGEILFTLGIFDFFLLGNHSTAEDNIQAALLIYGTHLGNEHPSTLHVINVLSQVKHEGNMANLRGNENSQFAESQEFNYVDVGIIDDDKGLAGGSVSYNEGDQVVVGNEQ